MIAQTNSEYYGWFLSKKYYKKDHYLEVLENKPQNTIQEMTENGCLQMSQNVLASCKLDLDAGRWFSKATQRPQ